MDEAFRRLFDRGFVVSAKGIDGTAAAYWASVGLDADTAAENLANINVRIDTMAAAGASELSARLCELGVRVVDQSADLTVVPVDDYLDDELAEFNRQRLAQKQKWLLMQPAGLVPLVGPIFSPGKSACWTCLADRMKWNRQIKALLDRKRAQCVAASPLGKNVLAGGAVGLAAVEIAKAVASGFRTDLLHHIVSLDLVTSTVARHHVPARPQCPSCGSQEQRDLARVPAPTRLRVGGKAVMTSGGYRSVTSAETVARFRKHVSPLTGVVSQLERIKSEQAPDIGFLARYGFSPRPEALDAPQARLIADSYGKGTTADECEASALMQAIERHCGIFRGDEIRTTRRFVDFPAGDAIPPNDILLLSDAQYEHGLNGAGQGEHAASIRQPRWSGRQSGRCATKDSSSSRPAFCIFFTKLPAARSVPTRTAVLLATSLRKRSSKVSWNSSSGMPAQSGGTIACGAPRSTSTSLATTTSGICGVSSLRRDAADGCWM
jgi:oxazoline/thiazoline synthase